MNYLYITNCIIDDESFSKNIATFLLQKTLTQSVISHWDTFYNFKDEALTNKLIDTTQIMLLPTQSKQDLAENLIPYFVKYSQSTFLILGNLSELSQNMQEGLLRFVEEPPQNLNLILTAISKNDILDTLMSRCELKILPTKIAIQYTNREQNEQLLQALPKPKDFIHTLMQNQKTSFKLDFKNITREAWDIWLWQLEYLCVEILNKNHNLRVGRIFQNIIQAKKLNRSNVLNRLVWAKLFDL